MYRSEYRWVYSFKIDKHVRVFLVEDRSDANHYFEFLVVVSCLGSLGWTSTFHTVKYTKFLILNRTYHNSRRPLRLVLKKLKKRLVIYSLRMVIFLGESGNVDCVQWCNE